MELQLIDRWTPTAGRVVEWAPTAAGRRAAELAPIHPIEPSPIQERHLRRAAAAARRGEAQSPWLGLAFDFATPLDEAAMSRTIERYVLRNDTLSCWFSFANPDADPTDLSNALQRRMVPADAVAYQSTTISGFADSETVRKHVMGRVATGTSALGWPGMVFGAVEHQVDGAAGFTLFHAVDHAHSDLSSITLAFVELREIYTEEAGGPAATLPPAGSHIAYSRYEREHAESLTPQSPEVQAWMSHVAATGGVMPRFPLDLGADDRPRPAIGTRVELLDGPQSEQFAQACRANGGGFAGGVFAALAIAQYELSGQDNFLALSPVATRSTPEMAWAQGWFINLVPVGFALDDAKSFADLVGRARAAFQSGREVGSVSIQQALDIVLSANPAVTTTNTGLTIPPIVSYMDGRRLPQADAYTPTRATALVGGKNTSIASMWINRLAQSTWVEVSHPDTPEAHESVARYCGLLAQILSSVATTGDRRIDAPLAVGVD